MNSQIKLGYVEELERCIPSNTYDDLEATDIQCRYIDSFNDAYGINKTLLGGTDNKVVLSMNEELSIQKMFDALPFYALLVDESHNILMANREVEIKANLSRDKIIGNNCPNIIHRCDTPIYRCPLKEVVTSGISIERELFEPTHNKWFLSSIYPTDYRTKEGKNIYLHTVYDITKRKKTERHLSESLDKLNRITDAGIQALVKVVEKRDPYTAGHLQRVSNLACAIAEEMNLSEDQIEGIRAAGLLHDIGKVSVPIEILCKPGKLNVHEFNLIKEHSLSGYEILADIDFPWPVAQIVLQHHERLDGSGYPKGLLESDIMIEAKILCVADTVEAMCSHRPYRPSLGIDIALAEINNNKGIFYDEKTVDVCTMLFMEKKYNFK